jgi:hypothetical protein
MQANSAIPVLIDAIISPSVAALQHNFCFPRGLAPYPAKNREIWSCRRQLRAFYGDRWMKGARSGLAPLRCGKVAGGAQAVPTKFS